jgi:dTDP-4-amino-4,6-dideoxygalactose transaminase
MGMSHDNLKSFIEEHTVRHDDGFCYNKITGNRIPACIPMHTFGHPCRISDLASICKLNNIALIEDAAESIGSTYMGQHTGTFGLMGIQSFNGNKTITSGGGGMILTNDADLARKAKHLSTQAKVSHPYEFNHDSIGYNYRMPNINAALGLAQLENLEAFIANKRELANEYKAFFEMKGIRFFIEPPGCRSNYWLNSVILNDKVEKDYFLEHTNKNNVMTRPIWNLINTLPMYSDCQTDNLKNANWLAERVVNLPSSVRIEK